MDTIAFAAGATLSAMLGLMQWRVDRAARWTSGYLLLWVLGFVWTFGNFLRAALDVEAAAAFAWSCTLLGPVAIGRLLQGGIGHATPAARVFFGFTVGAALLNLVLFLRAIDERGGNIEATSYPTMSFYVALVVGLVALAVYLTQRPRGRASAMPRWFAPTAFAFAAIHTTCILVSMLLPGMPESLMTATSLVARHWTIPWSVLIAASLAQAHYADVVLKRSLWLLASFGLAAIVGGALAGALATAAALLAAPLLIRALDAFVDRAILQRPDYAAASKALDDVSRRASRPEQLIDAALESVRTTLHVDTRWVDAGDEPSRMPLASVVVNCADRPAHRLEITASHGARRLLQRELAFLESVGTQLGHRLEALHLQLREERLKRLLTEAELKALRTQVDPHFLFNTLNTIADLIVTNPGQAERMTERLAECFRYALAKHSRDLSTLDEELDFARHYLAIEQIRFGDRLRVQLDRGDATGQEAVPSLLLQPLLENAIRHGLAPVREGGCVSVHAQRDGERLQLDIEDDGVGIRDGSRSGVGLRNVEERLRTLYAQAADFFVRNRAEGRGTRITIVIPLNAH